MSIDTIERCVQSSFGEPGVVPILEGPFVDRVADVSVSGTEGAGLLCPEVIWRFDGLFIELAVCLDVVEARGWGGFAKRLVRERFLLGF